MLEADVEVERQDFAVRAAMELAVLDPLVFGLDGGAIGRAAAVRSEELRDDAAPKAV